MQLDDSKEKIAINFRAPRRLQEAVKIYAVQNRMKDQDVYTEAVMEYLARKAGTPDPEPPEDVKLLRGALQNSPNEAGIIRAILRAYATHSSKERKTES